MVFRFNGDPSVIVHVRHDRRYEPREWKMAPNTTRNPQPSSTYGSSKMTLSSKDWQRQVYEFAKLQQQRWCCFAEHKKETQHCTFFLFLQLYNPALSNSTGIRQLSMQPSVANLDATWLGWRLELRVPLWFSQIPPCESPMHW